MTSKDGSSLSEEEIDEIVERVVDELGGSPAEKGDRSEDDDRQASRRAETDREDSSEERTREREPGVAERARKRAERVEERADRLEDRVERKTERLDRLGEQIEDEIERHLDRVADSVERSLAGTPAHAGPAHPPGPEPGRERAVYKTQLQKGGRIAVPDAEIEALDLEPGDTLQVTLYEVD